MEPTDMLGAVFGIFVGACVIGGLYLANRTRPAARVADSPPPESSPAFLRILTPPLPPPSAADDGHEGLGLGEAARRILLDANGCAGDPDVIEALWWAPADAVVPPLLARVAGLVAGARDGDPTVLLATPPEMDGEVDRLFAATHPAEVSNWMNGHGLRPTPRLLAAFAARDPERAADLASLAEPLSVGPALLAALDAGCPSERLQRMWDERRSPDPRWRCLEVQRLARVDLEAGLALFAELEAEGTLDDLAARDLCAVLGREDGPRALDLSSAPSFETDRLPRLEGCRHAGLDVGAELARIRAHFTNATYDPWTVFKGLLALGLVGGKVEEIRAALEVGGPRGWQVASAAWSHLRARPAEERGPLLGALRSACKPGVVASRDAVAGAVLAGRVAVRPAWLARRGPRPLDRLALFAGEGGVDWSDA